MAMLLRETLEDFELEPDDVDAIMAQIGGRAHIIIHR